MRIAIPRAYVQSPARRNREAVKHEFPQRSFPEEISAASPKNISAKRSVAFNDESRAPPIYRKFVSCSNGIQNKERIP